MHTVIQEKINTKIAKEYLYKFSVSESSLYIIEISAQAKSWRQNLTRFGSFLKDDDLAIKINNQDFPKLNGKKGLFDGEVAWNGNNLKGLSKTDFFVVRLKKGEHTINFIPDQKPFLETITVYQIEDQKKIVSKYYEGDKGYQESYHAITPESDPYLYYKNILGDKEEEIIITGKNNNGTSIFYILKKTKNGFATVSNIDKFGSKNPAFRGNNFDFVDFDKDGTMEVRELFYQPVHANLWGKKRHIHRVWYSYNDEKGML